MVRTCTAAIPHRLKIGEHFKNIRIRQVSTMTAEATSPSSSSKRIVYIALAGNLLVAATKAVAAVVTGSSAMVSEAVHSFVDTGNQVLLLYGMRRAAQRADPEHPIGYGRELYFWSFIVALTFFALGAGVSIYEGILHLQQPEPIKQPVVNYVVLGLAFIFEGYSWLVSFRQFKVAKGTLGYYEAFRKSKDPPLFMVLFEDSAAMIGICIAGAGTFIASYFEMPIFDGIASILIGVVLGCTAGLLARESKSLLIGERADPALTDSILRIAAQSSVVSRANGVLTVQLAPDQILAALSVESADDFMTPQIEAAVVEMEQKIRAAHPEVVSLFIKPQTATMFKDNVRKRFGEPIPESGKSGESNT
jgi:cation diffusion facilitator family transporter